MPVPSSLSLPLCLRSTNTVTGNDGSLAASDGMQLGSRSTAGEAVVVPKKAVAAFNTEHGENCWLAVNAEGTTLATCGGKELSLSLTHSLTLSLTTSCLPSTNTTLLKGKDTIVKLWDVKTCASAGVSSAASSRPPPPPSATLKGASSNLNCIEFAPDGSCVLAGSSDGALYLWSQRDGRLKHKLTGHSNKVHSCAYSNDCERVVSGSQDRNLKLWGLQYGYCERTFPCRSACFALDMSFDNATVCSGHQVRLCLLFLR